VVLHNVVVHVTRGSREAILVEHGAKAFGSDAELAGEFDFLVTDGGDFREHAGNLGFHEAADGGKLESEGINAMFGCRKV
jgi:hypothetical protein